MAIEVLPAANYLSQASSQKHWNMPMQYLVPLIAISALDSACSAARDKLDEVKGVVASVFSSASKKLCRGMPANKGPQACRGDGQCAICLGCMTDSTWQQELPCGHTFHSICVHPWLSLRASCPICRQPCTLRAALTITL